ncbi:hypothetical protein PG985_008724 [Apiospora marii]|uniref:uncharacterized protein n=1 Tax=Apiospora marii TaxID=335849 RepID=UPI00312FC313
MSDNPPKPGFDPTAWAADPVAYAKQLSNDGSLSSLQEELVAKGLSGHILPHGNEKKPTFTYVSIPKDSADAIGWASTLNPPRPSASRRGPRVRTRLQGTQQVRNEGGATTRAGYHLTTAQHSIVASIGVILPVHDAEDRARSAGATHLLRGGTLQAGVTAVRACTITALLATRTDTMRWEQTTWATLGWCAPSQHMVQHSDAQRWSNGTGAGRHPPGRGMAGTVAYSSYYQEPVAAFSPAMPHSTVLYQYGQVTREPQDTGTCNPSLVYNIPHTSVQSTVYHTNQPFPLWQRTALRRPACMAASYLLSEPADTRTAPALPAQAVSSGASEVDPPVPAEEGAVLDGQRSAALTSGIPQASEAPEEQGDSASTEMGEAYAQYQTTIKEIFTNIHNGVLVSASESLVAVSNWLLSKVTELDSPGLATDNPRLYHDRIKLWHDFNHAWLALLQKQKDMVGSGIALQDGQTLVREESLKKIGKEMVRLCDKIENLGLVDYEYGVWEEPIIEILTECLDLYENSDGSGDASLANPSASR